MPMKVNSRRGSSRLVSHEAKMRVTTTHAAGEQGEADERPELDPAGQRGDVRFLSGHAPIAAAGPREADRGDQHESEREGLRAEPPGIRQVLLGEEVDQGESAVETGNHQEGTPACHADGHPREHTREERRDDGQGADEGEARDYTEECGADEAGTNRGLRLRLRITIRISSARSPGFRFVIVILIVILIVLLPSSRLPLSTPAGRIPSAPSRRAPGVWPSWPGRPRSPSRVQRSFP